MLFLTCVEKLGRAQAFEVFYYIQKRVIVPKAAIGNIALSFAQDKFLLKGGVEKLHLFFWVGKQAKSLSPLATDAAGELDVLGHDGHTLGMDGSQVGVLEQTHQVGLSSLLQGKDCRALEAQVSLEVLFREKDECGQTMCAHNINIKKPNF